jgi:D-sedoheptulose 7-phosphate isomerase
MREIAENYQKNILILMNSIQITDQTRIEMEFCSGIGKAANAIVAQIDSGHKIMFIGNGGSAAICSHMSTDFLKNGGMRAMVFTDGSLLTCLSNDLGYPHVFEKPIDIFAEAGDVLVAISSSGESDNILRGVRRARLKKCKIITLSGFSSHNSLNSLGDLNFFVPSFEYGPVEIVHQFIFHCILDVIVQYNNNIKDIRV